MQQSLYRSNSERERTSKRKARKFSCRAYEHVVVEEERGEVDEARKRPRDGESDAAQIEHLQMSFSITKDISVMFAVSSPRRRDRQSRLRLRGSTERIAFEKRKTMYQVRASQTTRRHERCCCHRHRNRIGIFERNTHVHRDERERYRPISRSATATRSAGGIAMLCVCT